MTPQIATLPVAALEVCDRTRVRQQKPKDGSDVVLDYAGAYESGQLVPPLEVFREKGTERYIVADGEHRLLALRRAKIKEVECRLHEGDEIDALDFGLRCNHAHGLRRTKADIYHGFVRIMETRLRDKYRTDRDLSEQLGVSIPTIQRCKVDWRNSEDGNARVRAKKQKAQEAAAKRPGRPKADLSIDKSQVAEATSKISAPARTGAIRKPIHHESAATMAPSVASEAIPVSAAVAADPSTQDAGNAVCSASAPSGSSAPAGADSAPGRGHFEFMRALVTFRTLPSAADFRATLNGTLDWDAIEHAHQWLTELLAER